MRQTAAPSDLVEELDGGGRAASPSSDTVRPWEIATLAIVVASFICIGLWLITTGPPLGHDESVYALRARYFAGEPAEGTYWADYRAPGLPAMLRLAYVIRPSDAALRNVPLVLAALLIVLTWVWGRHLFGRAAGILAAALLAFTPGFMRYAWQILLDIPGAAFSLAAIVVFTLASSGDRLRSWVLLAIPFAGAATAVRYGAPVFVCAGIAAVALTRWRSLRSRPWLALAAIGGSVIGMLAVLTVPVLTGSDRAPWIAFRDFRVKKGNPLGGGLRDFAEVGPALLGRFVGWIVAAGLVLCAVGAARRWLDRRALVTAFTTLTLVVIGLGMTLGQGVGNYLAPALVPLMILAAGGLTAGLARVPPPVSVAAVAGFLVIAPALASDEGSRATGSLHRAFDGLRRAATRTAERVPDDCVVFTSFTPQVGWYSRCTAIGFAPPMYASHQNPPDGESLVRDWLVTWVWPRVGDRSPAFLLQVIGGKRSPIDPVLAAMLPRLDDRIVQVGRPRTGRRGFVTVRPLDIRRRAWT